MSFKLSKIKKPFIIAELSANHNGKISNIYRLIDDAKKCGASAIKIQSYTAKSITLDCKNKYFYVNKGHWKGSYLHDIYRKGSLPFEWHKKVFTYAKKKNILCFSTPFSEDSVDFLENLNCQLYKVSSFEMTDIPLIKKISQTKKPMIISTGMANLKEIDTTFNLAKKYGSKNIVLLYCVSNYPAKKEDFNLNNIKFLKNRYKCPIGFSDHSNNYELAAAAVSAGAEIFEKHIYLKNIKSVDWKFSLKGSEIKKYREVLNNTYEMMGKNFFYRSSLEKKNRIFRRSIYTYQNIKKGEKFTTKNIKIVRPGYGIEPIYYSKILNKKSPVNIFKNTKLSRNILKKLKIKIIN